MSHPLVVHCKREEYDIYVGRPSKWGNPFKASLYGRERALHLYRRWLAGELYRLELAARRVAVLDSLDEMEGKVLGCWCAPKPCHGDILAALANGELEVEEL